MHRLGLFGVPHVDMLRWQRMGEVADGGVMVGVASSLLLEVSISSQEKTNKERKKNIPYA